MSRCGGKCDGVEKVDGDDGWDENPSWRAEIYYQNIQMYSTKIHPCMEPSAAPLLLQGGDEYVSYSSMVRSTSYMVSYHL